MTGPILVKDLQKDTLAFGRYLIIDAQLRTARNGKTFISARLGDSTGQIALKLWGGDAGLAGRLAPGAVLELRGITVREFNQTLQLEVEASQEELFGVCEPSTVDMSGLLPVTPADPARLWEEIVRAVDEMQNPELRALLEAILFDESMGRLFREVPAATRRHHAYVGGLLEHTTRVTALCRAAASIYPGIDGDLLIAGALLHDIGKIETYQLAKGFDLTDDGRFFGHLMLGVRLVEKEIARLKERGVSFDADLAQKLLHMLLSHHGIMEWGSPVEPLIMEACILHHADNMDAQAAKFTAVALDAPGPGWVYEPGLSRTIYVNGGAASRTASAGHEESDK